MTMNKHAMFINYILSQRFLLNFNVTPLLAHYHTKHFKDVLLRHSDQKSFIVLLESRIFFVFGYLGVWGNLRRQQKTLIFFCAFGGLGVWGNFFWVNFRRHPLSPVLRGVTVCHFKISCSYFLPIKFLPSSYHNLRYIKMRITPKTTK